MALRSPPSEIILSGFPSSVNGGVSGSLPKLSRFRGGRVVCDGSRSKGLVPFSGGIRVSVSTVGSMASIAERDRIEKGSGGRKGPEFLLQEWIRRDLSAPLDSGAPMTKVKDEDDGKRDYYVNLGYAIRTLREELRDLFYKEPSFDIYRDDIVFKDPLNTFWGIDNYKRIMWALRVNGKIFFKALWVDILSIWQPVENVIMIRWTVHGVPRVPWDSHGRFDGTSEYKLDKDGKIYEHRVDNIAINSPPKFRVLAIEELIQSLGCPSTPRPTYFECLQDDNVLDEEASAYPEFCSEAFSKFSSELF